MDLPTFTLSHRQLSTLRHVLGMQLDMHFDDVDMHATNGCDQLWLVGLQELVDVCDKVDVEVPREVRCFLADRR